MTLDVVLEQRAPVGIENAPLTARVLAGPISPTAPTHGDLEFEIKQFYVRGNVADNKIQYAIAKLFAPNFVDAYRLFDDSRQFFNQAISTSPTIPSPLRGLGAVAVWYPTETEACVQGGVFTDNSDDTGLTVNDVFEDGEQFYKLEPGWSALARTILPVHARGPMDTSNVSI